MGKGATTKRVVYLLRHAKSSWKDDAIEDFDRPLSKRGRQSAKAMGRYLRDQGIEPAQILCSSSKRTRETLDRVQKMLGSAIPTRYENGIYLAEASVLIRRIRRLSDSLTSVMLIGHNPGLERLALMLTEGDAVDETRREMQLKFPTGSLAIITTSIDHWLDLKPGCGKLQAFIRGRDLNVA